MPLFSYQRNYFNGAKQRNQKLGIGNLNGPRRCGIIAEWKFQITTVFTFILGRHEKVSLET